MMENVLNYFSLLDPAALLRSLPGGVAQGLIWGIMALGVYITYRLLDVADLTVDGSFTTGGAVAAMLILGGCPPWLAMAAAALSGMLAGLCTGFLHTKLGIPAILAGILTQLALYSIDLRIMGMASNKALSVDDYSLILSLRNVPAAIVTGLIITAVLIGAMYWYFGTEKGSALRATGSNPAMCRALGININAMKVRGLAISNAVVAFAGALMAQYQGFADVNMGRGAIVIGLAAVIMGEVLGAAALKKRLNFWGRLSFISFGGIMYYCIVVAVLWLRFKSSDLKLFTALIVAAFLAIPNLGRGRRSRSKKPVAAEPREEKADA